MTIHPDIELIWQSDRLIAVNKPAGLLTQAPSGIESLESRLRQQLDRAERYLSLPHRLDRAVSGVLLVALTKKAARLLSMQFSTRKTRKQYIAMVQGCLQTDQPANQPTDQQPGQQWDDYIRKVPSRALAEQCGPADAGAKLASTLVRTICVDLKNHQSRLELTPITGRMHQLRLQTALRGHPIVGDEVYGAGDCRYSGVDADRILLHAHRLGFHDPASGKWTDVNAPCPF